MSERYAVPFGRGRLTFDAPAGWQVDIAVGRETLPPVDATRPLHAYDDAIGQARRVVIVFTDATRECPDQELAERILRQLRRHSFPEEHITFLCAVGTHRPSTWEEKLSKLGPEILARYPVEDHDPGDVVTVATVDGVPVQVNSRLVEPGTLIVALGVVEPHQYAGYSGGAKTAVIGCGGLATITATHGPRFLDQPGVRLGNIAGNPFQQFVRRAGALIGLRWVVNVVLNGAYQMVDCWSGPPDEVHDTLVARARQLCEVPVAAPYDVVIAGVGVPKDANLYQASRAATYIGLSSRPVIRSEGVIIVPAPIPEGAGRGIGERNFIAALRVADDLSAMMDRMRREGCRPGEQRAYMVAQLLANHRVIVVGARDTNVVRAAHFTPVESMEAAFAQAEAWCGNSPRVLLVPHALQTIPVIN